MTYTFAAIRMPATAGEKFAVVQYVALSLLMPQAAQVPEQLDKLTTVGIR
jgi:hypothetical protein